MRYEREALDAISGSQVASTRCRVVCCMGRGMIQVAEDEAGQILGLELLDHDVIVVDVAVRQGRSGTPIMKTYSTVYIRST